MRQLTFIKKGHVEWLEVPQTSTYELTPGQLSVHLLQPAVTAIAFRCFVPLPIS
jgi:hypothetical protein